MIKRIIYTILLVVISYNVYAQKSGKIIVIMKSGTIIEGESVLLNGNDFLTIKSKGIVDPIVINTKEILGTFVGKQIDKYWLNQESKGLKFLSQSVKNNFKEIGLYITVKGQLIAANDGERANGVNGYGVSISAGHRFSRLLAVGGGIGYDQFIWDSGEEMIPLFAEVSGFFNNTPTSVFYNLQTGYSVALSDDDFFIANASGGLSIYPSIGIRLGRSETKMTLDIGYKIQNATYSYTDLWINNTIREQELTYKRLALRLGVLLQ